MRLRVRVTEPAKGNPQAEDSVSLIPTVTPVATGELAADVSATHWRSENTDSLGREEP